MLINTAKWGQIEGGACLMLAVGLLLVSGSVAAGQARTISRQFTGAPLADVNVGVFASIRKNCMAGPPPTIRLAAPPVHGKLTVKQGACPGDQPSAVPGDGFAGICCILPFRSGFFWPGSVHTRGGRRERQVRVSRHYRRDRAGGQAPRHLRRGKVQTSVLGRCHSSRSTGWCRAIRSACCCNPPDMLRAAASASFQAGAAPGGDQFAVEQSRRCIILITGPGFWEGEDASGHR